MSERSERAVQKYDPRNERAVGCPPHCHPEKRQRRGISPQLAPLPAGFKTADSSHPFGITREEGTRNARKRGALSRTPQVRATRPKMAERSLTSEVWNSYDGCILSERGRRTDDVIAADFLIGGHATVQCDRLLTRDRGFYKTYFTPLALMIDR